MVTAIETRPGTDPDRASFTTAMEAARDQLATAQGICPGGPPDLTGAIGRAVLATLLPARRPGSAPARSNAPPPGTSTARTADRPIPPPSPRSTSPSAPRPSTSSPAGPAASGTPRPVPARPGRPPAGNGSPPSSPATPHATGAATSSPSSSASNPATCSPSSANGPAWASSPAPASAPTASTRRLLRHPRQTRPTLNFAALLRGRYAPLTRPPARRTRQLSGTGSRHSHPQTTVTMAVKPRK
jgi:hypothetical protein